MGKRDEQSLPGSPLPGRAMPRAAAAVLDILLSRSPKRRLRLLQWLIASVVYFGIFLLLLAGVRQGWMHAGAVAAWAGFVGLVVATTYVVLRSGWSERFSDPAMTLWQLYMGVIAVNWGYVICGPMRTSSLFPLMVIFAFAAYSLRFRQIAWLTLFAVASLMVAVAVRQVFPAWVLEARTAEPLQVDINNLLAIIVVLPALALIAARLSALRIKLRDQRAALTKALSEVERLAVSDELTGLPNRRAMMGILAHSAAHARRGIAPFCVAMLDLDHFKRINDTLGHATGDAVLQRFALVTSHALREGDVLGRWGGEEFLLVLPGATLSTAQTVLARLRAEACAGLVHGPAVTFSAGVAAYRGTESADALLARADAAMYAAKRAGRDRVELSADLAPG